MCLLCATGVAERNLNRRTHMLQLLALVEHPDALPADAALRIAREILALSQQDQIRFRCDSVIAPNAPTQ